VPVPCFLLFLCFRKVTQEIFLELDETKAEVPIFPDMRQSPKQRWRGARGQPHLGMQEKHETHERLEIDSFRSSTQDQLEKQ
jgi:hypothetical protein